MFDFITITIRITATTRTIVKRKTRAGGDNQTSIDREARELVTGRTASPDLPRNDAIMIIVMLMMIMGVSNICALFNC
jgi:hypothetical protein